MGHNRCLVYSSIGDENNTGMWLRNDQGYDIAVTYYGKADFEAQKQTNYFLANKDFKIRNFLNLVWMNRDILRYDYYLFIDDDLIIDAETIKRTFQLAKKYKLDLCQPSLTADSATDWPQLKNDPRLILEYTNFVEIQCFCVSRKLLQKALPFFGFFKSGYGLDLVFSELAEPARFKVAVIHALMFRHPQKEEGRRVKNLVSGFLEENKKRDEIIRFCLNKRNSDEVMHRDFVWQTYRKIFVKRQWQPPSFFYFSSSLMARMLKVAKRRLKKGLKKCFIEAESFFYEKCLFLKCFWNRGRVVRERKTLPGVIVSLTSIPARIPKLWVTIESLLRQTQKPEKIVLWLSQDIDPQRLPWQLKSQQRRGLTIFYREHLGCHTKIHYALKEFPKSIIVTCDDDTIYPSWWLEKLYATYQEHQNCIICHRARKITLDDKGFVNRYCDWGFSSAGLSGPSHLCFATGVGGVLYPPGLLHHDVLNKDLFLKLCPKADDVWLKAMAMIKGTPHVKVAGVFNEFVTTRGTQGNALYKTNMSGLNDQQIEAVFSHYQLKDFFVLCEGK